MKKLLFLLALAFFGCQKKHAELDFFEVRLDGEPAFSAIGKARLRAEIFNLASGAAVDECGFFVSESLAETDSLGWPFDAQKKVAASPPASDDGFFEAEIAVEPSQTFYIKAFCRQGERVVFSKIAEPIGLPALVETEVVAPRILNDAAWLRGFLIGLDFLDTLQIVEHGHVFSSKNALPTVGGPDCFFKNRGPAAADGAFETPLTGLDFNTDYWARAYVKTATGAVFHAKKVVAFRVRGGWRAIADFPMDYYNGSAAALGDGALASFGINSTGAVNPSDYPVKAWFYRPATDVWEEIAPYSSPSNPVFPHTNSSVFVIGDQLFANSGEYELNNGPLYPSSMMVYDFGDQTWKSVNPAPTARSGAVAFSINGKGYFGSGTRGPNDLSDFWEYDPTTNVWRKVKSLPIKISPSSPTESGGRREASAFSDGQQAWVGGGVAGVGDVLSDFWRFVPPTSLQDSGSWETPVFFPGAPRIEAVSLAASGRFFYGLGDSNSNLKEDWWEFDPMTKTWVEQNKYPGGPRSKAMAFSINERGYVGTGLFLDIDFSNPFVPTRDFWMFVPNED